MKQRDSALAMSFRAWRWIGCALALVVLRGLFTVAEWPVVTPWALAALFTVLMLVLAGRESRLSEEKRRRDPAALWLVAFLGVLLTILFSHSHRLWGDAVNHYTYLLSIMEDSDLDFENNARDLAGGEPSPTYTHYSIGPALVWLPGYVGAGVGSKLTGRPADGWNALYRNAAALSSLLFGWSGLLALFLAARRLTGSWPALLASLAIGGGTFLFGYLAWAPTESHSTAFAAAAWLVFWASRLDPLLPWNSFFLGALLGFATIQRWQAAVLIFFVGAAFVQAWISRRAIPRPGPVLLGMAGAFLLFLPQAMVWKSVFGAWLTIPQGPAFVSSELRIEGVLFSPRHGLFSWSPILYLAIPGFVLWARREPWLCVGAVLTFLATVRTNAGLGDWFGGSAFGARRFDLTLPLFGIALAWVFQWAMALLVRRPQIGAAVGVGAFVAWNFFFASAYFDGRFPNAGSVPFVDQAAGVSNQIDAVMGSPFSLPAALYGLATKGRPLSSFEPSYLERPYSSLRVRMGSGDRLFLDDGWSPPYLVDDETAREVIGAGAGVNLPIHVPRAYRLGVRGRGKEGPIDVELWVNDYRVAEFRVGPGFAEYETPVGAEILRRGANQLRIVPRKETSGSTVVVSGVWLEPGP